MVKINVFFVVIILGFFVAVSSAQKSISFNTNAVLSDKQLNDSDSKKTSSDLNYIYLNGNWNFINNNDIQDFTISLVVNGVNVTGNHCFVYGEFGDKIDCPDNNSIYATSEGGKINGKIISDWANDSINIELKLLSKDSLCLIPLSDAGQSFFQTKMIFVKKAE